jgi:hypothetical protein
MECRFCGRPTEIVLGGVPVCEECYQNAGSRCLEFGGEDLWAEREELKRAPRTNLEVLPRPDSAR